ncbi:hypothetical protein JOF29_004187 [Kribbella aluminosa]|uniref:Uncharacterized protein n=1 Tax=Kribbella aluminosa TaxID=416017 RepID=A0ABS4UNA4_9ACTN|nr:hypothetical protein [Kribbella aluminosa]
MCTFLGALDAEGLADDTPAATENRTQPRIADW